jgi:hypothetical protein
MKISKLIGTGALLFVFGIAVPAYAQEDQTKPPDTKPSTHDEKQAEPPKSPNDQPRPENKDAKPPAKEEKPAEAPRNEKPTKQDEKTQRQGAQQAQRGGGQQIPDDKFKAHFGQEHHFHIGHPVVVGGRSQFTYGGYNFYFVQAWPAGWGWNDDVYIIDVDGVYYLVDAAHPGVQLELEVVL